MPPIFDAIIIGAGPAGATAAILLARAGWSVALVERQAFPRRKVCGECVAASNLPLLDALGIGDLFMENAGPELRRVALMWGRHTVVTDLPTFDHPMHRWGRALGRETLDLLLIKQARASGVCILQPWSVRSLSGTAGNFLCTIRAVDSKESAIVRAHLVIAAHGSWQPLPTIDDNDDSSLRPGDLLAFKANFRNSRLEVGLLPVIAFNGGYGGMVVADKEELTIACCIRADRLALLRRQSPGKTAGEVVSDMLQGECAGVAAALADARRDDPWLAVGPLHTGIHFGRTDQVFRIGNAAAEAHPIIGEGMSMAMQSAWLLCRHLVQPGSSYKSALHPAAQRLIRKAYAADWRRHFKRRLRLAAAFAHLAMRPTVMSVALPLIKHGAPFLKQAAALSGKVQAVLDPIVINALSTSTAGSADHTRSTNSPNALT